MRTRRKTTSTAFVMVVCATALSADKGANNVQSNETRFKTSLAGPAIQGKTPEGHAAFRSEDRGRVRFNVEVEYVNLDAGTVLTISVQDGPVITVVDTLTLSAFGGVELELNSEDGNLLPTLKQGDVVNVSTSSKLILAGAV